MAVFSVNQATQMYVGASKKTADGIRWYVAGDLTSEMIKEANIIYESTAKTAESLNVSAVAPTITVSGTPAAGDEYLIRLIVTPEAGPQYAYIKSVAVVVAKPKTGEITTTTVATQIKEALNKASRRDVVTEFYKADSTAAVVTIAPELIHETGKKFVIPGIEVSISKLKGSTIEELKWVNNANTATVAGSGLAKLKDLEYFCAGERGDVYRGAMWPNEIPFESKITGTNPTVTAIHYYEDLGNEAVQKSEKTIVLVANE